MVATYRGDPITSRYEYVSFRGKYITSRKLNRLDSGEYPSRQDDLVCSPKDDMTVSTPFHIKFSDNEDV